MATPEEKERELERRERELREREQAIRLKELEEELQKADEAPYYETQKHEPQEGKLKQWSRKLANIGKFLGITIAVIVSVKIAAWLTSVIIIGGVAWIGYKLFLEEDRRS